jgi:hypothetical protein
MFNTKLPLDAWDACDACDACAFLVANATIYLNCTVK